MNTKKHPLSESQVRDLLKSKHADKKEKLHGLSLEMAKLTLGYNKSLANEQVKVSGKNNAFTAFVEQMTECTAIIEFVESLGLFDQTSRSKNIKDELVRRHAGLVSNLERSTTDLSGRMVRIAQAALQARSNGTVVSLGEKIRSHIAGDHARLMKDIAIIEFIESLGIFSRLTRKNDL